MTTLVAGRRAFRGFFASLRLSPSAWIGAFLLFLFLFAALLGPWLAPYSPTHGDLEQRLLGPSLDHWLGTDENGIDLLSAMLYGARLALLISGITVFTCAISGVILGTAAGYFGGVVDEVIMRVVDVLLAFPGILLNLAIIAVVRKPGIGLIIFALVANGWLATPASRVDKSSPCASAITCSRRAQWAPVPGES